MQTQFTSEQLSNSDVAHSESVIRKCVHCGFCTATCPTYVLLGDELDSPRGRIYLIKEMLEKQQKPTEQVVTHIDRCLSCLSCMTTCPSGVNYMHLVDHARSYVESHYRRPLHDRLMRFALAKILPFPGRIRLALRLAGLVRWLRPFLARHAATQPAAAMLRLSPRRLRAATPAQSAQTKIKRRGRVVLAQGCVENVLRPEIRASTIRLLTRMGFDVDFAAEERCCGALTWHLGRTDDGLAFARRNVDAWMRERQSGLDAIVITASGCGTTIKDYGHMLRDDPVYAEAAKTISALAKDVSEVVMEAGPPQAVIFAAPRIAYLSPCSMQHAQKIRQAPITLLRSVGYDVREPAESHLCCGSAGSYNILQPAIAAQLGARKAQQIEYLDVDVIATGNIGCATQIACYTDTPVLHTVELLDWATGGPVPSALRAMQEENERCQQST